MVTSLQLDYLVFARSIYMLTRRHTVDTCANNYGSISEKELHTAQSNNSSLSIRYTHITHLCKNYTHTSHIYVKTIHTHHTSM